MPGSKPCLDIDMWAACGAGSIADTSERPQLHGPGCGSSSTPLLRRATGPSGPWLPDGMSNVRVS
jgi:hypothetical protein